MDSISNSTNHTSYNGTEYFLEEEYYEGEALVPEFKIFCFILYSLIFLLGMAGNLMFCYVVISSRSMKSVTYRLLVNLSIADLLITCLCGPVHVVHTIVMGVWPFGRIFCYAISYFQGITVLVSSYTLVVISFERYMSILYPLRSIIPRGRTRYIIFGIWTGSALASIPNLLQTNYLEVDGGYVCTTHINDAFHYYSLAFCIFQYFLPVVCMTYFYYMVATTIFKRRDILRVQTSVAVRTTREVNMLNGRKKMIKMLIVVVVCYTICWLPFNIFWVLGLVMPEAFEHLAIPYIFTIVHILAVSHTCYNPVIYCWMNSRVRYGFIDVSGKLSLVRKCFPWLDFDTARLSRTAHHSQYGPGEARRATQRIPVSIRESRRPVRKTTSVGPANGGGKEDIKTSTTAIASGVTISTSTQRVAPNGFANSHQRAFSDPDFNGRISAITSTKGPVKVGMSGGIVDSGHDSSDGGDQNSPLCPLQNDEIEMSEFFSDEPCKRMANKGWARGQKISVTSNCTQITNITIGGEDFDDFDSAIILRSSSTRSSRTNRFRNGKRRSYESSFIEEEEHHSDIETEGNLIRSISDELKQEFSRSEFRSKNPPLDERYN